MVTDSLTFASRNRALFKPDIRLCAVAAVVIFLFTYVADLPAQDPVHGSSLAILDGNVFEAKIVREDGTPAADAPLIDRLEFDNGFFVSEICTRYDFAPAQYWVRSDSGAIRFYAEMRSPTSGVMIWTGAVHNGELEGTMHWTRKRWYRTIIAEHRIAGKLITSSSN